MFRLNTFFIYLLPWIGLMVFEDDWCTRFGTSREELRGRFFSAFIELFEKFIKPSVWGDGLERLRETMKRHESEEEDTK